MTREEFERAITCGLGRVIQYLQTHDARPYQDIILNVCLHNTALDTQAEGTRSQYLFEITNLTNNTNFYRDAILAALAEATDDDGWQIEHLFNLAGEFAKDGDEVARQTVFAKVDVELANNNWIALALIEYFGVEGFLFLIDLLGQEVLETGEFHDGDYYLRALEEHEPPISKGEIKSACDAARKNNLRIEAYLSGIENYRAKPKRAESRGSHNQFEGLLFDRVRILVNEYIIRNGPDEPYRSLWRWGVQASETQLLEAAEAILNEEDEAKLSSYLWIFRKVPFPSDLSKLISIARHDNYWLSVGAFNALQNIADPAIHELALSLIEEERHVGWVVGLLQKNLQAGDWELITELTSRDLDADTYHLMGIYIRELVEHRPELPRIPALVNLYERGACSMCREHVVELMHETGQLPHNIREECKYDANIDLRKRVQKEFV